MKRDIMPEMSLCGPLQRQSGWPKDPYAQGCSINLKCSDTSHEGIPGPGVFAWAAKELWIQTVSLRQRVTAAGEMP